ncbi:MAG: glycoside hydrolase family 2, partial [Lachnospiraceae bacterium]|nr:glycoside hydrolase family 2 [Lachnospiraceae bacterium]
PFMKAEVTYRIDGNGRLAIHCEGETADKVAFLPRLGIRLFLPKSFNRFDYLGFGPYESYIDKHQASYFGAFGGRVCDAFEDYVRPQENGSHWGCKHLAVRNKDAEICFTAPSAFSFNVSEYTQEELAAKRHNFELEKCRDTVLCVDSEMAGVGSASCGPALDARYRITLPHVSLDLCMEIRPAEKK